MLTGNRSSAPEPIPRSVFATDVLPPAERFTVWRDSILPLFEALPDASVLPEDFGARVDGFNLQQLFFCQTAFSAQRYRRRQRYRVEGGADHLLVQLYLDGGYEGHNGYRNMYVGPGDISLIDLAHPLATSAKRSNTLTLVIPHDLMYDYIRPKRVVHGTVLRAGSPLAEILGHHLLTVWRNLPSASVTEIESVNHILLGAVAGVFARGASVPEKSAGVLRRATLARIRAYIDRNLAEPLTTAELCRRFGCSRTRLYRLFQPLGGVAAYIRQARLNRCLDDLAVIGNTPLRIIDVASRWGFSNQSHFCRLFHASFGMTPSDAVERGMVHRRQLPRAAADTRRTPAYHHWLRQL